MRLTCPGATWHRGSLTSGNAASEAGRGAGATDTLLVLAPELAWARAAASAFGRLVTACRTVPVRPSESVYRPSTARPGDLRRVLDFMAHPKNSLSESMDVIHSEILFPSSSIPSRGPT
jgi:hypothetical protein